MKLRAVVVDDSVVFRRVVADALTRLGVEVVATASNGLQALERIRAHSPDVVTLDLEMPEMGGLEVLETLAREGSDAGIVVLTSLSAQAGAPTVRALELGAFDFVEKPAGATPAAGAAMVEEALRPRVSALARRREIRTILGTAVATGRGQPARAPAQPRKAEPPTRLPMPGRAELVVIGVSTGGPSALARLLPAIPADIGVPLLVAQHMPPLFTRSLADSLAARCAVAVREAAHDEVALPNTVYIAPGGRHLRIVGGASGGLLQVTEDPPENNCRPAVDYLFRSAAIQYPGRVLAVILTGMGSDGVAGLKVLKRGGCYAIAQDEASCVVYGMPRSAVEAGVVDAVLPLTEIAPRIVARIRGSAA